MGVLFNFLSSFLLGAGAGLALTLVLAVIAWQLLGLQWIKNLVLSVLFFIFGTFQIILLFSAYTTKDYVNQAYNLINTTTEYVDVKALAAMLPDFKEYIPEEYLPEEATEAMTALADTSETVQQTSDMAVKATLGLINAVNDTVNAYILRRWLWLLAELVLFFVLATFMRRKTPKYSADADFFSESGSSGAATMNF